jgi:hypothetical protein
MKLSVQRKYYVNAYQWRICLPARSRVAVEVKIAERAFVLWRSRSRKYWACYSLKRKLSQNWNWTPLYVHRWYYLIVLYTSQRAQYYSQG